MRDAQSLSGVGRGLWLTLAGLGVVLVGVATLRAGPSGPPATFAAASAERIELVVSPLAPTPVLMEPRGGPILWGINATATEVALDGRSYALRHAHGTGALVRFGVAAGCADGALEVVRPAPAPRRVTRQVAAPSRAAYLPDGHYAFTIVCDRVRGLTTEIEITGSSR